MVKQTKQKATKKVNKEVIAQEVEPEGDVPFLPIELKSVSSLSSIKAFAVVRVEGGYSFRTYIIAGSNISFLDTIPMAKHFAIDKARVAVIRQGLNK